MPQNLKFYTVPPCPMPFCDGEGVDDIEVTDEKHGTCYVRRCRKCGCRYIPHGIRGRGHATFVLAEGDEGRMGLAKLLAGERNGPALAPTPPPSPCVLHGPPRPAGIDPNITAPMEALWLTEDDAALVLDVLQRAMFGEGPNLDEEDSNRLHWIAARVITINNVGFKTNEKDI